MNLLVSFFLVIGVLIAWVAHFDIIPDSTPIIGLIDDIIIAILGINLAIKVYNHGSGAVTEFIKDPLGIFKPIFLKVLTPNFVLLSMFTGFTLIYILTVNDGIPDVNPIFGYLDDAALILANIAIILRSPLVKNLVKGKNG